MGKIINYAHMKCHDGKFFYTSHYNSSVADAASVEVLFTTNSSTPHYSMAISVGGNAEVSFFEDTTVSASGTELTVFNTNRVSTNTPTPQVYHTPTVTDDGTELISTFIPGGEKAHAIGGEDGSPVRTGAEFILSGALNYLVRVTNISGTAQPISVSVGWYE